MESATESADSSARMDRAYVHSLPSDYSDVQSNSYDPDFISEISNKMQVPDRIALGGAYNGHVGPTGNPASEHMMVPDRIVLAGGDTHIGMKEALRPLAFDRVPDSESLSYVGLITPPRTLTLEERFPTVEDVETRRANTVMVAKPEANGMGPVPYTPGVSPYESLLLNEEDEATLLRTQVSKLTRRLTVMEQDNQRRSQRELFLYPAVFGYLLFRVFFWFMRNR
ncbi:mitochondrial fission factor-like [Haliotis cracherodii]|uniref:mitochondrial fission factor-like n=1 Tax=Haliotis cracherodii TaxID=6455 RepID=UPI0039E9E408